MSGFVICLLVACVFVGIGVFALFAKKPVHFWSSVPAPKIKDARRYNRAVAVLCFVFAAVLAVLGIPLLAGQNAPLALVTVLGTPFACIGLMAAYMAIERRNRLP